MNPLLRRVRNKNVKHVVACETCDCRGWVSPPAGARQKVISPVAKCSTCNGVGVIPVCHIAALIGVPTKTLVRIHTGYSRGSKCGARIVEKMFEVYPFLAGAA